MSPAALDHVLGRLTRQVDPNVLIGFEGADDAGVYKISGDRALVQTVDFFTPVVDDPYTFGQIAAVNALSDVYAMGGAPMTSLAIVCFPAKGDLDVLERILAGGLSKMVEAGCTVIGGHSIRDDELKFGYAVTGTIAPDRVLANAGAKVGDKLLLTKSIGTGVIATAIKKGVADAAWIDAATRSMTTLNKGAAEVATSGAFRVHGATDITGFGLIGHAREMALGSQVTLKIQSGAVPLIPGALECVRAGHVPGGLIANREFAECAVKFDDGIDADLRTLLFDPQTAGGLLLSVAAADASEMALALGKQNIPSVVIGEVLEQGEKPLIVAR